jgi:hypothetical protein
MQLGSKIGNDQRRCVYRCPAPGPLASRSDSRRSDARRAARLARRKSDGACSPASPDRWDSDQYGHHHAPRGWRRRQHVIPEPHSSSCGSICQQMPLRRTNKMPVRHARSEMRGRPPFGRRGAVGKNGSTRSHNGSGSSAAAIPVHATSPARIRFRRFCYLLLVGLCEPFDLRGRCRRHVSAVRRSVSAPPCYSEGTVLALVRTPKKGSRRPQPRTHEVPRPRSDQVAAGRCMHGTDYRGQSLNCPRS